MSKKKTQNQQRHDFTDEPEMLNLWKDRSVAARQKLEEIHREKKCRKSILCEDE